MTEEEFLPDILINFPEKTDATLALIKSKVIFKFFN